MVRMEASSIELILDWCLDDIRARRATVEQCLARYPDRAGELEPLLRTAVALRSVKEVKPSSEWRRAMRSYLLYLETPPPTLMVRMRQYLVPRRTA